MIRRFTDPVKESSLFIRETLSCKVSDYCFKSHVSSYYLHSNWETLIVSINSTFFFTKPKEAKQKDINRRFKNFGIV